MNTTALILMLTVQIAVTCITLYFFWKVLKTPPRPEPDSYDENDNLDR